MNEKKRAPELEDDEFEKEDEGGDDAPKDSTTTATTTTPKEQDKPKDPDLEIAEYVKAARLASATGISAVVSAVGFMDLLALNQPQFVSADAPENPPAKPDGPAQAAAENKPDNAAALTTLDTSFKDTVKAAEKSLEKLPPAERGGEAARPHVERQWQQKIIEIMGNMPASYDKMPRQEGEVDLAKVKEKLSKSELDKLTKEELAAAVKLEAAEGKFGPASELAYKRAMNWYNEYALNVTKDLVASGLRVRPGGPIPSFTLDADQRSPFGARQETFKAKILDPNFGIPELKDMAKKGLIDTKLILEPTAKPGLEELRRFNNSKDYIDETRGRILENGDRIEANRRYQVINEFLGIKDEGWKPPENNRDLIGYCQRADEVCNLMFRVRNYAESIKSLKGIDGDFKALALDKENFPGELEFDQFGKITKMKLDLPDSLAATPENERKLQRLRDWLDKYGPPVDQVLGDYMKGVPLRFGDFLESGKSRQKDGKTVEISDSQGNIQVAVLPDGTMVTRNLDGVLRDANRKEYDEAKLKEQLKANGGEPQKFDYIGEKFSTSRDPETGEIIVTTDRSFEKDTIYNYNRWLGDVVGNLKETRRYKPDDLVAVQNSSGLPQLIRADRLAEFQAIQALWHYGGKFATCAMDVGMIVTGSVGARAALQAGRMLYVATNIGRVALGAGGLLDPTFRQMGEVGESIRKARHAAILFDVTQGLLRQSPALFGSSKVLFEAKGAAEVAKAIEASGVMSRLHSATAKVFGVCDAIYLPMLTKDLIEQGRVKMGYNPKELLEDARVQAGSGRGTDGKPLLIEEQNKATRDMMTAYEKMLGIKNPAKAAEVAKQFEAIRKQVGAETAEAYRRETLAAYWLPNADQLLDLKKKSKGDALPRFYDLKEKQGSDEEKVAAAIGMLHLARQKDGGLPKDGVLVKRMANIPAYSYEVYDGPEGQSRTVNIKEQDVPQEVHLKDVIATLQRAALNAENPQTRAVAADALFRLGAMGSGRYAGVLMEHLEKDATTAENKDARFKLLRQVADLVEISRTSELNPPADIDARRFLDADNNGVSSEQLTRRLQEMAASEKDPDLRAMAMAILHARNFSDGDKRIDAYYTKYESLPPGKFREEFLAEIKSDLTAQIPEQPKEAREAAIERRLNAVKAFRNFEGSTLEADTFKAIDINKSLHECLKAHGGRDLASKSAESRLDLAQTMRIIDLMMARKDTLSKEHRIDIARTATGIMEIPYPEDGKGRTQPALAKLGIIARMKQIYEDSEPQDLNMANDLKPHKQAMVGVLKGIISPEKPGFGIASGWGQYPEMRVAAITGIQALGLADKETADLLRSFIDYDASKSGPDSFKEKNPHVRAAAVLALSTLAEYKLRYSEKDIKELEKKSPRIREELGLDPKFYVDELLQRERDPAILDVLWRVHDKKQRIDPQSAEYSTLFQSETEALNSAASISVSKDEVKIFVEGHNAKLLSPKYFEGEVQRSAEKHRQDPYSGFLGWCDSWLDSRATTRKKNEEATASARATAWSEKNQERIEALTDLSKMSNLQPGEAEMAIKTFMHLIWHPDPDLIKGGDTEYARIRASELILRLCDGVTSGENKDIVKTKELLSKVVVSCLLDSSIDTNAQVKYNLLKAVERLTVKDTTKANQGKDSTDFWLITPERAAMVYAAALQREKQRFDKPHQEKDRENSRAIQLLCLEQIFKNRGQSAEYVLDARGHNAEFKKYLPDVSEASADALGALRYGVTHLQKDAVPDTSSSLSDRADHMQASMGDAKFNYEGACIAMFRACKDKPIEHASDPRAEVLLLALSHQSERVRQAAAVILADSKIDDHFQKAVAALSQLAVNGSHRRYQLDASAMLRDIIQRGQPIEQDVAFNMWKAAYDARKAMPKDKQLDSPEPEVPLAIPDAATLGSRAVPVSEMDRLIRLGREPRTPGELKAMEADRVRNLARILNKSQNEVLEMIEDPKPKPKPEPVPLKRGKVINCADCHPDKEETPLDLSLFEAFANRDPLTRPRYPSLSDAPMPSAFFKDPKDQTEADKKAISDWIKAGRGSSAVGDVPIFGAEGRKLHRLAVLEGDNGIYPFVTESLERGQPAFGRPIWGQYRHRETEKLAPADKTKRNETMASTRMEVLLAEADSPEAKIKALRECCTRTPITSPDDRRVVKIVDLLRDRDESVRMEAAAIILRGSKENFVNKGFSDAQRAKAYETLNANVPSLIQKGINGNDATAYTLLDRAMEAKENGISLSLVGDHTMKRQPGWEKTSALLQKHLGDAPFGEVLRDGTRREAQKIPQGIVFTETTKDGKLSKVVTPDGVKYADLLVAKFDNPKSTPTEILKAANTLLDAGIDIGKNDVHKVAAWRTLSKVAENVNVPAAQRLEAAQKFMAEKAIDSESQDRVCKACVDLVIAGGAEKEAAKALLLQMDARSGLAALNALTADLQKDSTSAVGKAKLDLALTLAQKWRLEPQAELAAYSLWTRITAEDKESQKRLNAIVERAPGEPVTPISGKDDPRLPMLTKMVEQDSLDPVTVNAAMILMHKDSKDIPETTANNARVHVHSYVKNKLEALQKATVKPSDAEWSSLDRVLERAGQGPNDYSRLFLQSKRLEANGDNEGLVPVYEKLAQLSADRESPQAEALYKAKARDAKENSDPAIVKRKAEFAQALRAANEAQNTDKHEDAENRLKDALERLKDMVGANSPTLAQAYFSLSSYYKATGNDFAAHEAAASGSAIIDAEAKAAVSHMQMSYGRSDDSGKGSKRLAALPGDGFGPTVKLTDNNTLNDMLDYQLSKGVVGDEAIARAKQLADYSLKTNEVIFGAGSQQAARGKETQADVLASTGEMAEAQKLYKETIGTMNGADPGRARLTLKLTQSMMRNGGPAEHTQAIELMEDSLNAMQMGGGNPHTMAAQMSQYAQMCRQRGDFAKADELEQRMDTLLQTGKLPKSSNRGQYASMYPHSPGGGPMPGNGGPAGGPNFP